MTKAERIKICQDYLINEGFRPTIDDDGDIVFKKEGSTYIIEAEERDEKYYRVLFPHFWSIDNDEERQKATVVALEASTEVKVAKVYIVRDSMWASVEAFYETVEHFLPVLQRCVTVTKHAADTFAKKMKGVPA